MRVRVFRLQSANPVVAAILTILLLLLVVAVLVAGATLIAGVAVVGGLLGGATLLVRRALGLGRRGAPPPLPTLDPANEVFPTGARIEPLPRDASNEASDDELRRLPP